jgi:hypothetical protein
MAIEGVGAVFNDGSTDIGEVVTINIPDDEAKEYEVTTLGDTREQFKLSAMSVGQVCTLTIRLNPEAPPFTKGATLTGAVITLPKQDPTSTTNASYTFDCFVRIVSGGTADVASTEGITQEITLRLTSEVTPVNES